MESNCTGENAKRDAVSADPTNIVLTTLDQRTVWMMDDDEIADDIMIDDSDDEYANKKCHDASDDNCNENTQGLSSPVENLKLSSTTQNMTTSPDITEIDEVISPSSSALITDNKAEQDEMQKLNKHLSSSKNDPQISFLRDQIPMVKTNSTPTTNSRSSRHGTFLLTSPPLIITAHKSEHNDNSNVDNTLTPHRNNRSTKSPHNHNKMLSTSAKSNTNLSTEKTNLDNYAFITPKKKQPTPNTFNQKHKNGFQINNSTGKLSNIRNRKHRSNSDMSDLSHHNHKTNNSTGKIRNNPAHKIRSNSDAAEHLGLYDSIPLVPSKSYPVKSSYLLSYDGSKQGSSRHSLSQQSNKSIGHSSSPPKRIMSAIRRHRRRDNVDDENDHAGCSSWTNSTYSSLKTTFQLENDSDIDDEDDEIKVLTSPPNSISAASVSSCHSIFRAPTPTSRSTTPTLISSHHHDNFTLNESNDETHETHETPAPQNNSNQIASNVEENICDKNYENDKKNTTIATTINSEGQSLGTGNIDKTTSSQKAVQMSNSPVVKTYINQKVPSTLKHSLSRECLLPKNLTWNTTSQDEEDFVSSKTQSTRQVTILSPVQGNHNHQQMGIALAPSQDQTFNSFFTLSTLFSIFPINDAKTILYISVYSILGTCTRVFLARLFGQDCDDSSSQIPDFFSKLALCVTTSGKTEQRGGAIFIDLPANLLGSYIMGLMTGLSKDWPPIPWLKADHELQSNSHLHAGMRVGFCGCLTTFASWNTQMISMIDGFGMTLGSQLLSSFFGFLIGLYCSIMSFIIGRHAAGWINQKVNPHLFVTAPTVTIPDNDDSSVGTESQRNINRTDTLSEMMSSTTNTINKNFSSSSSQQKKGRWDIENALSRHRKQNIGDSTKQKTKGNFKQSNNAHNQNTRKRGQRPPNIIVLPSLRQNGLGDRNICFKFLFGCFRFQNQPFFLVACLMILFIIADAVFGIHFYRSLLVSSLLSPVGVILRWKLSHLNGTLFQGSNKYKWIPFGTLIANILGSVISAICSAILIGYYDGKDQDWLYFLLIGIKTGFAGSLSTVSTYVKEIVQITEKFKGKTFGYSYAIGSILMCCLLSISFYSIIIRA